MKRRDFVKSGMALGTVAASTPLAFGSSVWHDNDPPPEKHSFKLKYAPHAGMFKNHAGDDFIDQINFMADVGFTALEDNGMMKRDVALQNKVAETMQKRNMEMGVFVIDKGGNGANTLAAGKQEYLDIFLDGCKRAVEVAKRVNAKWMTVVPGDFQRDIPINIQTANVVEALRRGAEIFEPHGLVMVLEPLSDTPNLFLRTSDQTYLICKAVDSPSCKILYDIYHMQKNEGNLITNMDATWDEIDYIQIGDNPGRKEPTTGEINYKNVFKYLTERALKEFAVWNTVIPKREKKAKLKLIDAYVQVDDFKA